MNEPAILLIRLAATVIPALLCSSAIRRADIAFEKHIEAIRHTTDLRSLQNAQAEYWRAQRRLSWSAFRAIASIVLLQGIITFTIGS